VSWEWLVLVGIVAIWTAFVQALHVWKEVQLSRMMPEDVIRAAARQ